MVILSIAAAAEKIVVAATTANMGIMRKGGHDHDNDDFIWALGQETIYCVERLMRHPQEASPRGTHGGRVLRVKGTLPFT